MAKNFNTPLFLIGSILLILKLEYDIKGYVHKEIKPQYANVAENDIL